MFRLHHLDMQSIVGAFVGSFSLFYLTLLLSITTYRLSPFHPLAKYPGPYIARISKLWMSYKMASGKANEYIKSLHDTHGQYVRIGELFVLGGLTFIFLTWYRTE